MASQIVKIVSAELKRHNAKKVVQVNLVIGKFTFIGKEQLQFAYKILTEKTSIESSKLQIKEEDGSIRCQHCRYEGPLKKKNDPAFHFIIPTLECPECGNIAEIIKGKEFFIESIKMQS